MSDERRDRRHVEAEVDALFEGAIGSLAAPNDKPGRTGDVDVLLRTVEDSTPGGAGLHAQLDVVRRWHDLLVGDTDHARYGGTDHVRQHVINQLRLAQAAARDYFRHSI